MILFKNSMLDKFKKLSGGKKVGLIIGIFVFLASVNPSNSTSQANTIEDVKSLQSTQQEVDLTEKEIIVITEIKTETTTESIPFQASTRNDSSVEQGRSIKSVNGINGESTITYEVVYTDGVETSRKEISSTVTKQPVDEVTLIGTKPVYVAPAPSSNCDPNYTPCVPNVSYDLNCPDIGFMVRVIGSDPHRFDRDKDGYGCESYN